jgi:DNA ligase-1
MKLNKLYKQTQSGKPVYLQMYTKKERGLDIYTIYTETGTVGKEDKAKTSSIKIKSGKNLGKSNATTPKTQAEKEMRASWEKLWNEGYKEDITYVTNSKYNTFKDFSAMPQLLNKFKVNEKKGFTPGWMQYKKDGVRNFGELFNDTTRMKSREGQIFNVQHLLNTVTDLHDKALEEIFDGELYKHGVVLQDIVSLVKSNDPNQVLEFHIYDIAIPDLPFSQRRNLLLALDVSNIPGIVIDPGVWVNTEEEARAFYQDALDLGYEGAVYCDPDSMYGFGFRTSGKQKLKPRETAEFKCIGHYWNKGKMAKQSTLICQTIDGETFHVKLAGTAEKREQWANDFDEKVKDKMITVEYRKLTRKGIPHEAVGVAVRDYE